MNESKRQLSATVKIIDILLEQKKNNQRSRNERVRWLLVRYKNVDPGQVSRRHLQGWSLVHIPRIAVILQGKMYR